METRAGDAAGGADDADRHAGIDLLAEGDIHPVPVLIGGGEPIAVIDDEYASGEDRG